MSQRMRAGLLCLLALFSLTAIWWSVVERAVAAPASQDSPGDPQPSRERDSAPDQPEISFIDSPTAQCVKYEAGKDACYIQIYAMSVSAAPSYIISMSVAIDGRFRAYYAGFFQQTMYVPFEMYAPGFRVACGPPGTSPIRNMGKSYAYTIRARASDGLKSANYGQVTCPGDIVALQSASLSGPSAGKTGTAYDFTARVNPITATLPITYAWHVTGQAPITITGSLSETQSFSWDAPGLKQVTVTAFNLGGSDTFTLNIQIETPISGLAATNNSPTRLGMPTQLDAKITSGSNASFLWNFGDGKSGSGAITNHLYAAPGVYKATVTASNSIGSTSASTAVTVQAKAYLPLLFGRIP